MVAGAYRSPGVYGSQPTYEGLKLYAERGAVKRPLSSQPTYEGLKQSNGRWEYAYPAIVRSLPMRV